MVQAYSSTRRATLRILRSSKINYPHISRLLQLQQINSSTYSSSRILPSNFQGLLVGGDSNHRHFTASSNSTNTRMKKKKRIIPNDGITLSHFLAGTTKSPSSSNTATDNDYNHEIGTYPTSIPMQEDQYASSNLQFKPTVYKFHLKTYGCQMNVNDTDIVRSILLKQQQDSNIQFVETDNEMDAQVLLTNTCAIREKAESKIWERLRTLRAKHVKNPLYYDDDNSNNRRRMPQQQTQKKKKKRIIGVLGCMAERLKESMFEHGTADLIVGPDAYRDLPRLVSVLAPPALSSVQHASEVTDETKGLLLPSDQTVAIHTSPLERAINVQLSLDETYADITPIRKTNDVSAFVSVMRGCNNMCSFCVVPFTRGRERSRELSSIVDESIKLFEKDGVKEITLLGQNVNSYHDKSNSSVVVNPMILPHDDTIGQHQVVGEGGTTNNFKQFYKPGYRTSNDGFQNTYRLRGGAGYYFVDLVEAISNISPELRVRFTSPHPKDYPPELLYLMSDRNNVCNHLHMPAQSGSTSMLNRMRRGYSREAYLELIHSVRGVLPDVSFSSDFISGFCGETMEEHKDTVSLMESVKYDQAFMFAYSMRGRTHAHRTMKDDVPEEVKLTRLQEIISTFRRVVQEHNEEVELGRLRLVLFEGEAKKSNPGQRSWSGRTDQNKRLVFTSNLDFGVGVLEAEQEEKGAISPYCLSEDTIRPILPLLNDKSHTVKGGEGRSGLSKDVLINDLMKKPKVPLQMGDYAVVQVTGVRGHSLRGRLLWRATMQGFHEMGLHKVLAKNSIRTEMLFSET